MTGIVGDFESILSHGVGDSDGTEANFTEVLTFGFWDEAEPEIFPPPPKNLNKIYWELKTPISNKGNSNNLLFRRDNKSWTRTQKTQTSWNHQSNTLTFQVMQQEMKTFTDSLKENVGKIVLINTPGVDVFFIPGIQPAYIVDWSKPTRVMVDWWKVNVIVLLDPTISIPEVL